jgi:hypothetical protein
LIDAWEDIDDLIIPMTFLRWVLVSFNEFHAGMTYSEEAFKNAKQLLLNIFPLVSRDMTELEKERIRSLMAVPSYVAGVGMSAKGLSYIDQHRRPRLFVTTIACVANPGWLLGSRLAPATPPPWLR